MPARAKASTEGTDPVTVAEPANDHDAASQPVAVTEEAPAATETPSVPAVPATTQQPAEPGLPSPHQLHAKNWIEKTRVDWQLFRNGHDALVSELNGLDAAHDQQQNQRQAEFAKETLRISAEHDIKRDELIARINDMLDGLAVTEKAIEHYNERMQPETKNLRDDEQQEVEK